MELDEQIGFNMKLEEAAGELVGVVEAVRAANQCGLVVGNFAEVLKRWVDSVRGLVESVEWETP